MTAVPSGLRPATSVTFKSPRYKNRTKPLRGPGNASSCLSSGAWTGPGTHATGSNLHRRLLRWKGDRSRNVLRRPNNGAVRETAIDLLELNVTRSALPG